MHHESLVLTEHSYFDRLLFDTPLDIKLRSDSIGKGILFIGYSLTDINVRYLLYKLHKLWSVDPALSVSRPRSYMFISRPNEVQQAVLAARGIDAIISAHDDPQVGLTKFLKDILKRV